MESRRNASLRSWKFRNLYAAEKTAKERADVKGTETALFNERKTARRTSGKLVKEFFEACAKRKVLEVPSSPLAKAVNYALNQQSLIINRI